MLKKKSLAKNAMLNSLKTILAMIFPLITFPYASRVLQVENMGKVNYASSIISYFVLLAGLGIKTYAIREGARIRDNKEKLEKFSSEIFSINIISTIIAYVLLILVIIGVNKLRPYSLLLIIQSLNIVGTTLGVEWLYTIYEDYLYITIRSIVVQFVSMILLFVLVHNVNDYIVYASISVFATTASYIFNFFHSRKIIHIHFSLKGNLKQHIKPILIIFAMSVATTIYVNSDTTMLGWISGDYYVGLYNAATKVYNIVKSLMAASILVALPRLSSYLANGHKDEYEKEAGQILNTFILLLLPTIVGLFMAAKNIVGVLSGEGYELAVPALKILAISLLFSIIATYMIHVVLLPAKLEKEIMRATIVSAVVNILLNIFFIPAFQHIGAALTTVIAEFIVMLWQIVTARHLRFGKINVRDIIIVLVGCSAIAIICYISNMLLKGNIITLFVEVIFSICTYAIILILGKHSEIQYLKNNMINRFKK